jgi:hypothetical protein
MQCKNMFRYIISSKCKKDVMLGTDNPVTLPEFNFGLNAANTDNSPKVTDTNEGRQHRQKYIYTSGTCFML